MLELKGTRLMKVCGGGCVCACGKHLSGEYGFCVKTVEQCKAACNSDDMRCY